MSSTEQPDAIPFPILLIHIFSHIPRENLSVLHSPNPFLRKTIPFSLPIYSISYLTQL